MKLILQSDIAIFQSIDILWDCLISIDIYGHLWLPRTASGVKKSPQQIEDQALFSLSHFSYDSLCRVTEFQYPNQLSLLVVNEYARIQISITLLEDGNAVQLSTQVQTELIGRSRYISPFTYWYLRRIFRTMPARIRKMATQPF